MTTTDELIPSGEASSFRSNPLRLAEFTLSRKDPAYVGRSKEVSAIETARQSKNSPLKNTEIAEVYAKLKALPSLAAIDPVKIGIGSTIYATRPGDGSAREQAASCQRVLGAWANLCLEYATKRYRSNLINWGMVPFQGLDSSDVSNGEYVFIPGIRSAVMSGSAELKAYVIGDTVREITLTVAPLTDDEKKILAAGCLINYYRG